MDFRKLPGFSHSSPPPEASLATPMADPQRPTAGRGVFCTSCGSALSEAMTFCGHCGARQDATSPTEQGDDKTAAGITIFVSLGLGLLFFLLGRAYGRYLLAILGNQPFHTGVKWVSGPKIGQEVAYFELDGFTALADMGCFWLAVALILEAIAFVALMLKLPWGRAVIWAGVILSGGAVLVNLYAVIRMVGAGMIPQISIVALLIAGLSLSYLVKAVRAR